MSTKIKKRQNKKLLFLYFFSFGLSLLFFIDGPTAYDNRIFVAFWNNGHIFFFSMCTAIVHLLAQRNPKFEPYSISLVIAATAGLLIEFIQCYIGREFDWNDVYLCLLGALIINAYYFFKKNKVNRIVIFSLIFTSGLIAQQQQNFYLAIKASYYQHKRLPALATFDINDDLSNWAGENLSVTKINSKYPNHALKATLTAGKKYSTLTLKHFYKNWIAFSTLNLSIYLDSTQDLEICIKITDMVHDTGIQLYGDRFDSCIILKPKSNQIALPIKKIENSPLRRKLDIRDLSEITIFAQKLLTDKTIYIERIVLT